MRSASRLKRFFIKSRHNRRKTTLSTSQFFPVYSNCLYRHINIVSKTLLNILNIFYWTGENNNCRSDFCEAIWPFLVAGQLFGLLPVIRVKDRVASQLQFKWASLRTVYSLCILTILSFYTIFLIFETCVDSNTYATIALLLFYVSNTCGIISLFILAKQWPALMDDWRAVEEILPSFKNQKQRKNFIFKIRMIALLIFFQATFEHVMGTHSKFLLMLEFEAERDPWTGVLDIQAPLWNQTGPYPIWIVIFAKSINITASIIFNYMDVFVIAISIGLSTLFKFFNAQFKRPKCEFASKEFWVQRRVEYGRLRALVQMVDEKISRIILLVFFSHFVLLCKQLYKSLSPHASLYRTFYFWFSLIFLLFRVAIVSFSAISINDESKKPLTVLRMVPSQCWNTETKRFSHEVDADTIALSGLGFFYITRKLVLSMVSMVVTYELVIAQFHILHKNKQKQD